MRRIVFGIVAVVVIVAAALFVLNRDRPYDRSFDTRITTPAYPDSGPVVLYDEGHRNTHLTTTGYKPLADLIRNDGYVLRTTTAPFTAEALRGVGVLVLVLPLGSNPTNDSAAYSQKEAVAIAEWVGSGGSLLLVTDHWPFGLAARSLASRFAVELSGGFVEDRTYHDPERGESHLVFTTENGLLGDHAITRGRGEAERVRRVLTFTGGSMKGPDGATFFLELSDSATVRPPGPARAERDGGNERVLMSYGDPQPAGGHAQGVALEFGRGRVVVLGEAGMLRAQQERSGALVGMNVPGYDNRQLALNIMHWLSRVL